MESIPDHYRIKYRYKGTTNRWRFGIFEQYGPEVEKYWREGLCIIHDAVLPKGETFKYDELEIVDIAFGHSEYDRMGRLIKGDEYEMHIQKEYDKTK